MELSGLLNGLDYFEVRGQNVDIKSLSCDSKKAGRNSLFFCIKGTKTDGHLYASDAVQGGATALVVERFLPIPEVTQILVKDTRHAIDRKSTRLNSSH